MNSTTTKNNFVSFLNTSDLETCLDVIYRYFNHTLKINFICPFYLVNFWIRTVWVKCNFILIIIWLYIYIYTTIFLKIKQMLLQLIKLNCFIFQDDQDNWSIYCWIKGTFHKIEPLLLVLYDWYFVAHFNSNQGWRRFRWFIRLWYLMEPFTKLIREMVTFH